MTPKEVKDSPDSVIASEAKQSMTLEEPSACNGAPRRVAPKSAVGNSAGQRSWSEGSRAGSLGIRDDEGARPEPVVLALHHVSILVADTARACRYYEDVLCLKPLDRPDLGFPGAWLALGEGQQLHLMELPDPDPKTGRPEHGGRDRHFALRVADLVPFIERLERAGVIYTRSRSGRLSIFFRDPDGNTVELMGG